MATAEDLLNAQANEWKLPFEMAELTEEVPDEIVKTNAKSRLAMQQAFTRAWRSFGRANSKTSPGAKKSISGEARPAQAENKRKSDINVTKRVQKRGGVAQGVSTGTH